MVLWVFLQAFSSLIVRFIAIQEFMKIQTLLSTFRTSKQCLHLYGSYHSNATSPCGMLKGTYPAEAKSNSEKIKPVALTVIELSLSEGISQSLENSV